MTRSKNRFLNIALALVSFAALEAQANGEPLDLDAYLNQVEQKNQGIQSSRALSQGAGLRSVEGRLQLSPSLFGEFTMLEDERQTASPTFQGSKTTLRSYRLGISQQTTFGLQGRLYYNMTNTQVFGVNPAFFPEPSFYTASPVLDLSLSLWRNGFGSEVRALQEVLEADALAKSYRQSFVVKQARAQAELAYWNLALARENVRVQRDSLDRFEKMRNIYRRRSGLGLSDRADLLQSEAGVDARKLELQSALDQELQTSREFNTIRGLETDQVEETLQPISNATIRELGVPQRAEFREDVKATQQEQRSATAAARLGREKNSPTLEAFATLSINGRDPARPQAVSESFTSEFPSNTFGVRFSTPLDVGKLAKSREGYRLEEQGADLRLQRALYEQERGWNNLTKRLAEAKSRLTLAQSLVSTQKEKLDYERVRHNRGRTTTFQVLTFEQDYANAQLAQIQAQATVLQLVAEMKTFGVNQ